jgi:hypothetical protein
MRDLEEAAPKPPTALSLQPEHIQKLAAFYKKGGKPNLKDAVLAAVCVLRNVHGADEERIEMAVVRGTPVCRTVRDNDGNIEDDEDEGEEEEEEEEGQTRDVFTMEVQFLTFLEIIQKEAIYEVARGVGKVNVPLASLVMPASLLKDVVLENRKSFIACVQDVNKRFRVTIPGQDHPTYDAFTP